MWTYHNPVSVQAGGGCLSQLPTYLKNQRALLITFPEAKGLGLETRLQELLGDQLAGIENAIQPNPDVSWLAAMYERVWQQYPDVPYVIALGGGSVIDSAKAIITHTATGRFTELLGHLRDGKPLSDAGAKKLIAIPTTAGTGSEVTPWATIWDSEAGKKYSLHQSWTWPHAALIDPELMLSLPKQTTLASGLDALSHALESIWNVNRNPVSASLAATAARSIVQVLPQLIEHLNDKQLREKMSVAALQAGLAFSNTKTALAHSLSYDITLRHGVTHGIACSFSLPHIMSLAFGHDEMVDSLLLSIFGAVNQSDAIEKLTAFLTQLGISTQPQDYGVTEPWELLVNNALQGPRGRNFISTTSSL